MHLRPEKYAINWLELLVNIYYGPVDLARLKRILQPFDW